MVEGSETHDARVGAENEASLEAAREWIGAKLDEMGGASIGRVESLLVDARDGAPTWAVVRLGRLGRRCAVPTEFVASGVDHVWAPFTKETFRSAAEIGPVGGLSCGDERMLAARYGIPPGTGRLTAIEDLSDDEPGSVPAD